MFFLLIKTIDFQISYRLCELNIFPRRSRIMLEAKHGILSADCLGSNLSHLKLISNYLIKFIYYE